jgi:hypothetical protein
MKHVKPFPLRLNESKAVVSPEIANILDQAVTGSWEVNPSGEIDIEGNCDFHSISQEQVNQLFADIREHRCPKFGAVSGGFSCYEKSLSTLIGCPHTVGEDFSCSGNRLQSFEGGPVEVGGSDNCLRRELRSLRGAPQRVGGDFNATSNHLVNLEGSPSTVGKSFLVDYNRLITLKGAPQHVGGLFSCRFNSDLISLEGVPLEQDNPKNFVCDWIGSPGSVWPISLLFISRGKTLPGVSVRGTWERARQLAFSVISERGILDRYFLKNPLDLDLLDPYPDVKAGVVERTKMKDVSALARSIRKGLI